MVPPWRRTQLFYVSSPMYLFSLLGYRWSNTMDIPWIEGVENIAARFYVDAPRWQVLQIQDVEHSLTSWTGFYFRALARTNPAVTICHCSSTTHSHRTVGKSNFKARSTHLRLDSVVLLPCGLARASQTLEGCSPQSYNPAALDGCDGGAPFRDSRCGTDASQLAIDMGFADIL